MAVISSRNLDVGGLTSLDQFGQGRLAVVFSVPDSEALAALVQRRRRQARLEDAGGPAELLVTEAGTKSQTREPPIRDAEVRPALRRYLRREKSAYPSMLLIEELGLCQGQARIDLLTVSGVLHGYEIKSNRDRLTRLASQAATYSRVLDRVTLVVCPQHIEAALQLVPKWWGVLLVRGSVGLSRSILSVPPPRTPTRIPVRWSSCSGATKPWSCSRTTMHWQASEARETGGVGSCMRGPRRDRDSVSGPISA